MSRHWDPDEELARCIAAEEFARAQKKAWPEGATAGLILVAASCFAVGALLYSFAGPRTVIEDSVSGR